MLQQNLKILIFPTHKKKKPMDIQKEKNKNKNYQETINIPFHM